MTWINLRTEYSFGMVHGKVEDIVNKCRKSGASSLGIADLNSTWGHVAFSKACKENNIKPVFGVRLHVVLDLGLKERRQHCDTMTFIALNNKGLKKIYELVDLAHQQFYYKPLISYKQVSTIKAKDVAIIGCYSPLFNYLHRHVFLELGPHTPQKISSLSGVDYVACCDNYFISKGDEWIYEPFAEERKLERKTTPMHILTDKEWKQCTPKEHHKKALRNRDKILESAKAVLPVAKMVKFKDHSDIKKLCQDGAKKLNIDLTKKKYKQRYEREIKLIEEKEYIDYFLIVADLVEYSKKRMLVGHARGSSAGSLVCYLLGITEIDPLKYGLIFERFIDINREDLPDIDIDFQKDKRHIAIKYLQNKYGSENVAQLGNVSLLKPRAALNRFAKGLSIPPWEIDEFKNSIQEDEKEAIKKAYSTQQGELFNRSYPAMKNCIHLENHASHTSIHAAGVIVSNKPINLYCGVNSRDNKRIAMINMKGAEFQNLLKIDLLGLRTLIVISEVCEMVGMKVADIYNLPLDDKKTFKKIFGEKRLTGIFQFEGEAITKLAAKMPIENINDISNLTSLGRPGPLISGASERFVQCRSGEKKTVFISDHKDVKKHLKETYGEIVYQEQVMYICKEYAGMSWPDVIDVRKGMGKSLGDEYLAQYKKRFIKGAIKNNSTKEEAKTIWNALSNFGKYGFNKSHAVSYAMITYVCAYLKAHHPIEFAVATLNNVKTDRDAIKLLRDLRENEGIKHIAFDRQHSLKKWSVYKGKLLGGLLTLDGVADQKANMILKNRRESKPHTPGLEKALDQKTTIFTYIYPAKEIYGKYYSNPKKFGINNGSVVNINDLSTKGDCLILGCLVSKNIRDSNESGLVEKRGYEVDGPTTYLNLVLEDDTAKIGLTINRMAFQLLGQDIAEHGALEKDWYLVFGQYDPKWNRIYVDNIKQITEEL